MEFNKDKAQKLNNLDETLAKTEEVRIKEVRKRLGEEVWAEDLGRTVISHTLLLTNPDLGKVPQKVLQKITAQVEEVAQNPNLSRHFVQGTISELRDRRVLPELPE